MKKVVDSDSLFAFLGANIEYLPLSQKLICIGMATEK